MDSARTLTAAVAKDGEWYVARCLEIEVASQGETVDEALTNLRGKQVVQALESVGFEHRSTRGSHAKLRHPDGLAGSRSARRRVLRHA